MFEIGIGLFVVFGFITAFSTLLVGDKILSIPDRPVRILAAGMWIIFIFSSMGVTCIGLMAALYALSRGG